MKKKPWDATRQERKLKPIKQPTLSDFKDGEGTPLRWGGSSGEEPTADDNANGSEFEPGSR